MQTEIVMRLMFQMACTVWTWSDSAWCLFGPRWSFCSRKHCELLTICVEMKFVVLFLQTHIMPYFHCPHQASSVGNEYVRVDVLYFDMECWLCFCLVHVIRRTSPTTGTHLHWGPTHLWFQEHCIQLTAGN